jgi:hypothetical protein
MSADGTNRFGFAFRGKGEWLMRMTIVASAAPLLMLAACGGGEPAGNGAVASNIGEAVNESGAEANMVGNAAGAENITARVLTMSDRERNVVFVRALMDAGLQCDGVTASERLADVDGQPMWRADCKSPGGSHMVTVTPDGTAKIMSRPER